MEIYVILGVCIDDCMGFVSRNGDSSVFQFTLGSQFSHLHLVALHIGNAVDILHLAEKSRISNTYVHNTGSIRPRTVKQQISPVCECMFINKLYILF